MAHVKLSDHPTRTSNIAFGYENGQKYAYVTGTANVWRIKMYPILKNEEL